MNILDYAIVLTAFSTVDPMISQIEETIEEYVKDLHTINTAILSDGTYPWSQIRLSFPVLQRSLSLQTRLLTPISSLVIDFRNFTGHPMEPLQHLPNNTKKFIFLVDYENLKSIIKGMEDYEACNMLFLTINGTKLDKVKIKEPCKGIGAMPRNSRTKCVVNASVLSFPPATFYRSSTDIFGYEGLLFKTSAESLGLTVNYLNRSEKIGQADPPSAGALGDVVQKQSIATFGQLYSFQKRFWYLDLIQMCVDVDFSWAVPNQAGKAHPTWFIILVTEFSLTVWICLLLIYLTLVVTYFLMKDENMGTWSLGVFAVILGVPQSFEKNRAIMILVIIFGFTVTAHYKTMMSSKLTVPSPIPEIETNQELIDAGYRLLGIPSIGQIYRDISDGNPGDLVREEIANRYEPSVVDLKDHIFRIATMRDMAVTRSMDNIYYLSKLVGWLICTVFEVFTVIINTYNTTMQLQFLGNYAVGTFGENPTRPGHNCLENVNIVKMVSTWAT